MDIIKKIYAAIFTALFCIPLFLPISAQAYSVDWIQSVFGSGYRSTVEISTTTVSFSGSGTYLYLCSGTINTATEMTMAYVTRDESAPYSFNTLNLLPNKAYFVAYDNASVLNTTKCSAHYSQMAGADYSSQAYPYSSGGMFGAIYFETGASSQIVCYDHDFGYASGVSALRNCENKLFFAQVATEATTTINVAVDTSGVENKIASSTESFAYVMGAYTWAMSFLLGLLVFIIFKRK